MGPLHIRNTNGGLPNGAAAIARFGPRDPRGGRMPGEFKSNDRGKRVVTSEGDVIGLVERIEDGEAYVRPKRGILGGCGSWITDPKTAVETFPLDRRVVAEITDTEIHLEGIRDESRRSAVRDKIKKSG